MTNKTRKHFDVLVVGAGPTGLAAASSAVNGDTRIAILDDNPDIGGQIWRSERFHHHSETSKWLASPAAKRCLVDTGKKSPSLRAGVAGRLLRSAKGTACRQYNVRNSGGHDGPVLREFLKRLNAGRAEVLCGANVVHHDLESQRLFAERSDGLFEVGFAKLIIATGARERFLPFPGWTLPNVMAAGGLQAMVKSGLPIAGKRVVLAGTGPLLLAVAAYLRKHGAKVLAICEQASWNALAGFAFSLYRQPQKLVQASALQREIRGVPFWPNSWPVRALGRKTLEAVVLSHDGKTKEIACDYLACGFHLVPNTELASLLGCRLRNGYVEVDALQQTSLPNVFCAGEPTGIGGLELSLLEGQIAGLAAAGKAESAGELRSKRRKLQSFAKNLETAFRLRSELKALPETDTIVCRCEDVTHGRLAQYKSWRDAKNQTRCGMGPCQGRVCGPSAQFLYGWQQESIRPPVFPVRVQNLAEMVTAQSERTGEHQ